jgi:hypothetical protein
MCDSICQLIVAVDEFGFSKKKNVIFDRLSMQFHLKIRNSANDATATEEKQKVLRDKYLPH